MLNDKLIIEMSCNYVYHLDKLAQDDHAILESFNNEFPNLEIIDIQNPFKDTQLNALTIQDNKSKDVAIIFQGSSNLNDWKNDNLNNFLNKNVAQYQAALDYFEWIAKKSVKISYIGGNSLGGGCAQYVAQKQPYVRAICINASPLTNNQTVDNKNIINLRINADPLYRSVSLDKQRYENGYAGTIKVINRSLYGSYDYYNSIELAHKGSISFPYQYIYHQYKINNLNELKDIVDFKKYQEFLQLKIAPSLAKFTTFDLITNNLEEPTKYNVITIQKNYKLRINEIKVSLLDYHLTNLELKVGNKFLEINEGINSNLSSILKNSLLHITKQEETLYNSIYFVIEKSTNYFYKLITKSLKEIDETLNPTSINNDYKKIIDDIEVNKICIIEIVDQLNHIYDNLSDLDHLTFKKIFMPEKTKEFSQIPTMWNQDYQSLIFDKIDEALSSNIAENKSFIEQLEAIIFAALMAQKVVLYLSNDKNQTIKPEDIDYIIERYRLKDIITNALTIFKEDIYEAILAKSLLYIYLSNIRCINEQLEQLQLTLDNLGYYIHQSGLNYNKKQLIKQINKSKSYIDGLINYNKKSYIEKNNDTQ